MLTRNRSWLHRARPLTRWVRPHLEVLEGRIVLATRSSLTPLVQVSALTPFTDTSDLAGQSGTIYLNAEVEPRIAADPNNSLHLVGIWQQDRWSNGGSRGIVAGVTTDGGKTWTKVPLPGVTVNEGGTYKRASDPWISIGKDGAVYAVSLVLTDTVSAVTDGIVVSKSTDGGFTWANPVPVILNSNSGFFNDKESITADPTAPNNVYVTWDRLNSGGDPNQGYGPALFSRSTDGGLTFSTPTVAYDPGPNAQTLSNQIVVLPNGTLIDVFVHFNFGAGTTDIQIVRSTDKGTTWSAPIEVSNLQEIGVSDPETGAGVRAGDDIPDIGVDPRYGNVYVTWQDGRFSGGTHADIAFAASFDGGQTWGAPVKANKTPTGLLNGNEQAFTASLAVAPNGTVAVTYYDFRNNTPAPGLLTDYFLVFANPRHTGWTFADEKRISATSFDLELAANAGGLFLGDYEGVVAGGIKGANAFTAFYAATVSTGDPSSIFARDPVAIGPSEAAAELISSILVAVPTASRPLTGLTLDFSASMAIAFSTAAPRPAIAPPAEQKSIAFFSDAAFRELVLPADRAREAHPLISDLLLLHAGRYLSADHTDVNRHRDDGADGDATQDE